MDESDSIGVADEYDGVDGQILNFGSRDFGAMCQEWLRD